MATNYNISPQVHGINGFGCACSDVNYVAKLAAATETNFTVPGATGTSGGVYATAFFIARIKGDGTAAVFFTVNDTAAVPATSTLTASTSALADHNEGIQVRAGDKISLISAGTPYVSVSLQSIYG